MQGPPLMYGATVFPCIRFPQRIGCTALLRDTDTDYV